MYFFIPLMPCLLSIPFGFVFFFSSAQAKQLDFSKKATKNTTTFHYQWTAPQKETQQIQVVFSQIDLQEELNFVVNVPMKEYLEYQKHALKQWASTIDDIELDVTISRDDSIELSIGSYDEDVMRQRAKEAQIIQAQSAQEYLKKQGYIEINNEVMPDYSSLVSEYSKKLYPLSDALFIEGDNFQSYAIRTLHFVQNIPYEASQKISYRRPIRLLWDNKGDCDSKTVLYLALLKSKFPDVQLAVVNIPEHTFAFIQQVGLQTEMELQVDGQNWVPVEPVGPNLATFGNIRKDSLQYLQSGSFQFYTIKYTNFSQYSCSRYHFNL